MSSPGGPAAGGPPAFPPPEHPEDPGRGPMILGTTWTLTFLCIVFISARLLVRVKVIRAVSADDWFMLAAGMLQVTFQACVTRAYLWGFGKHDKDLTFDPQIINILKWVWISTTPAILVSILARISAAILLIRIFGNKKWLKWFLVVFTTLQSIVAGLVIIFVWAQVSPVEGLWNPLLPARRWNPSIQQNTAYLGQSLFTFSDLTYVLFPIMIIFKLNMPLRRKLGLAGLMAASLFTMVASIMKTVTSQASSASEGDLQYRGTMAIFWSAFEQSFVIIMTCIPPLRSAKQLFKRRDGAAGSSAMGLARLGRSYRSSKLDSDRSRKPSFLDEGEQALRDTSVPYGRAGSRGPSSQSLETGNIRRTDQYAVAYSGKAEPREDV
ncbi:integral membrane protein [Hirsutella rhossiliensis]|uniref:Integral membrane protein n=1 Tax=Hirsutella rhossiliensis TaxID=111463 RepID=A0A9P8SJN1_9HYPO|nr:uncharacterized protein HRG_03102 [Hirsutella rhossiliensis]KAH0965086.1 integral membrane protein [Hirsutella rhossiliensis]